MKGRKDIRVKNGGTKKGKTDMKESNPDKVIKKKLIKKVRVTVSPTVFVTNYLKCGALNHSQRFCTKEGKICFSCGSRDHLRKDCKDRFNRDVKCVLCKLEKKPCNNRSPTDILYPRNLA